MSDLLKKIYESVIFDEQDTVQIDKTIDNKIHAITDKYKDQLTIDELEELLGLLYHTALISKQEGFRLGMKYLLKIIGAIWFDL